MEEYSKMNGVHNNGEISEKKTIVTYEGDKELFQSLEATLVNSLPQEPADWSRSFGRATKSVNVSAAFVPFSPAVLQREGHRLINEPVFHTYWTQCPDVEAYKATIRDDIEVWMKTLLQHDITDWMIVLVETYDFKKTNKLLPRTTVLDKIRSDFGLKHSDRCLSVINPLRSESRSAGSWRGLVVNMRLLILYALDRSLSRFEETIRKQREGRNQPNWTFTKYFLLQEELAFVLEMLGVYEEALVQYDELDALFTQFILNSNLGECPEWVSSFKKPLDSWSGLSLNSALYSKVRCLIQNDTASLLQLRNYLFSRQCAMLLAANQPAQVAKRTLSYLHNCIRELAILEVVCPRGSVASWVFLSCLEVLQVCQQFTDTEVVERYSLHTAGLWAYARVKLGELGELCGLMPPSTKPQLHMVVEISMGLGEDNTRSIETLKQALSSQQTFSKQYLELSELAISTYKHIGRMRSARALGHELAQFYMAQGELSVAASFLQDSLHSFERDGWPSLANHTRLQLANCYLKLNDVNKYVKMCASIACSADLDSKIRITHFDEMVNILKNTKTDCAWTGCLSDCLMLKDIEMLIDKGCTNVTAALTLVSHFPSPVCTSLVAVAVLPSKHESKSNSKHKDDPNKKKCKEELALLNPLLQKLPVTTRIDYQQDRSIAAAVVDIRNQKQLLRRQDSHGKYRKISSVSKSDFSKQLKAVDVVFQPGVNSITLSSKELVAGHYRLGQFSVNLYDKLELLSIQIPHKIHFEVVKTLPKITLADHGTLVAGINQVIILQISSQGFLIPQGSKLEVVSTDGLALQLEFAVEGMDLVSHLEIELPEITDNHEIPLSLLAQLPVQSEPVITHSLKVKGDWCEEETELKVSMEAALSSDLRVYTCLGFKFLHVTVGAGKSPLRLHSATLSCPPSQASLIASNPPACSFVLKSGGKVSYMWKLVTEEIAASKLIKIELTLNYELMEQQSPQTHLYKCIFDLLNYQTLFQLEGRIEPLRGSEFCRINNVCHLIIKVTRLAKTDDTFIMYEVSAETNRWAVCGRNTGVISVEGCNEGIVIIDVMPLVNGFLPLPTIKLSRYILAKQSGSSNTKMEGAKLEQFYPGQVYYVSKGYQVHVIAGASP